MLLKPATFLYAALLSLTFAQAHDGESLPEGKMRRLVRGSGQESLAEPLIKRQSSSTANAAYLMVHFKETGGATYIPDQEQVYFSYANNSNPQAMTALKKGNPVLTSKGVGASGARDPSIYSKQDGSYIVMATDSNISAAGFNFDQLSRTGSKYLLFWDSVGSDVTQWSAVRRVRVATATMGMAWSPEAVLDPSKNQYMVTFATRIFAASDTNHTGTPSQNQIWAAYTSDFKTFGTPFVYLNPSSGANDMTIRRITGSTYVRFFKEEDTQHVHGQISTGGLFGTWNPIGSNTDWVDANDQTEGPLLFKDNLVANKYHIWVDRYGNTNCQGYVPYETNSISGGAYTPSSTAGLPACGTLKQGRVIPITAAQRSKLLSVYPS